MLDLIHPVRLAQKLHIELKASNFDETGLPENKKLMLYRIIQEALSNIIKHAQATAVQIKLVRKSRAVVLCIRDNGQGFALENVRKGLGLANIRNRAELFAGIVTIKTAPGAGCTLKVVIPNASRAS